MRLGGFSRSESLIELNHPSRNNHSRIEPSEFGETPATKNRAQLRQRLDEQARQEVERGELGTEVAQKSNK